MSVGSWCTLTYSDGEEEKFRSADWMEKMKNEKFRNRIMEIIDEEVIRKFDDRTGEANAFYDTGTGEVEETALEY